LNSSIWKSGAGQEERINILFSEWSSDHRMQEKTSSLPQGDEEK
jgi:hypothetical protein